MSMDKEELYRIVNGEKPLPGIHKLPNEDPPIAMNILRVVIALVEIRESIDDLRSEMAQMTAVNSQLFREMLIQHGSATDPRDVRSAGIG